MATSIPASNAARATTADMASSCADERQSSVLMVLSLQAGRIFDDPLRRKKPMIRRHLEARPICFFRRAQ